MLIVPIMNDGRQSGGHLGLWKQLLSSLPGSSGGMIHKRVCYMLGTILFFLDIGGCLNKQLPGQSTGLCKQRRLTPSVLEFYLAEEQRAFLRCPTDCGAAGGLYPTTELMVYI